ncbi:MAG: DUF4279 domain-containing protein [Alphaproteobacteria bacterium]|nr:MAG: DUF4279 domain-containing protein [Alphaproteobacteria bacterium]
MSAKAVGTMAKKSEDKSRRRPANLPADVATMTGGKKRRFDVELFIVHPTMEPAAITAALGLEPKIVHRVGDQRKTLKGTLLKGRHPDTRWRYSARYTVQDQSFVHELAKFVDYLIAYKAFLRELQATGGEACVGVQFLGDGYFGDRIEPDTLAKLADLEVGFGIECYMVPQSP